MGRNELSPRAHERQAMTLEGKQWNCPRCSYTRKLRKGMKLPYCYGLMTVEDCGSVSITADDLEAMGIDTASF